MTLTLQYRFLPPGQWYLSWLSSMLCRHVSLRKLTPRVRGPPSSHCLTSGHFTLRCRFPVLFDLLEPLFPAWHLWPLDLRFEMEDKNLNLVPRTSSARKLTYSSEDIKRKGQDLWMKQQFCNMKNFFKSCFCTKFNKHDFWRSICIHFWNLF